MIGVIKKPITAVEILTITGEPEAPIDITNSIIVKVAPVLQNLSTWR
jgi:hypothetical protein